MFITLSNPLTSLIPPLTHAPPLYSRCHLTSPITFLTHYSLRHPTLRLPSAVSHKPSNVSWVSPDEPESDHFGGWAVDETPNSPNKKGFPTFLVAGVGTSVAVLVSVLARFALSKNGLMLPFQSLSPSSSVEEAAVEVVEAKPSDNDVHDVSDDGIEVSEKSEVDSCDNVVSKSMASEKCQPRVINIVVDSNQQEALYALKKLKILDEDVKGNELCTRREYARWLVRASSLLERNPKYKVTTAVALSGSLIFAYEDVTIGDPDFENIQALAEAGVIPSKLSLKHKFDGGLNFSPERYISRQDLIEWRSQLEYDFGTIGNPESRYCKQNWT